MVQPALLWLYHRGGTALRLRSRMFQAFRVEEVTNLAAVRHELFPTVIGPACIFVIANERPTSETALSYFAPKPIKSFTLAKTITLDSHDVSQITHAEASSNPLAWSVFALGGQRDWNIIRKLSKLDTLAKLRAGSQILARGGVVPGDQKKELPELRGKRYFAAEEFPDGTFLEFDVSQVSPWQQPCVDRRHGIRDYESFKNPQLLIKQSFSAETNRFRAALIRTDDPTWGVVCKETYLSVRDLTPDARHIRAACLAYNSLVAVYFLALTSSRFPLYNNEVPTKELRTVPLPRSGVALSSLNGFEAIDEVARQLFELTHADWTVIEDLLAFTLPDCLRKTPGPGRNPTTRTDMEPDLSAYALTMFRVLKSTFGKDKGVSATVYQEPDGQQLPARMVTFHFDWPGRKALTIHSITADGLLDLFNKFGRKTLNISTGIGNADGLGFQRVSYLFHSDQTEQGRIRSLTIIKPDERRYWTRSLAMRDADDLAVAILKAAGWKGGS